MKTLTLALVFLRCRLFVCLFVQFFVTLQYHKHHQSVQSASHADGQLSSDADVDDVMSDNAMHVDSGVNDVFSKSEAS